MDRPAKLRKLNAFRRCLPHTSASALAEMFALVEKEGVPELHNRKHMQESRDLICNEPTPFGPTVQHMQLVGKGDQPRRVGVAHPLALLWTALVTSVSFAAYFEQCLAVHPSTPETPWNLILYSDEVTP